MATPRGRTCVEPAETVAAAIQDRHPHEIAGISAAAETVAESWEGWVVSDRTQVVDPLRTRLTNQGILESLPTVIETAADVLGAELVASPVPAPPYVVITSRGPVLRGTLPDTRVVITVAVFRVDRGAPVTYRRREDLSVSVECRDRPDSNG